MGLLRRFFRRSLLILPISIGKVSGMTIPVPFLVTDSGVTKTISAPHMIATMLHHLELDSDLYVLLMASKGGYLATLIDIICGKGGRVTIIEPHDEVAEYTSSVLEGREQCGLIRVLGKEALEDPTWDRDVDRVLFYWLNQGNSRFY